MRNAYNTYFEEEILSATPLRLVCLLYEKAISELRSARTYLMSGQVAERCAAISKACDVLAELTSSLDLDNGGILPLDWANSISTRSRGWSRQTYRRKMPRLRKCSDCSSPFRKVGRRSRSRRRLFRRRCRRPPFTRPKPAQLVLTRGAFERRPYR